MYLATLMKNSYLKLFTSCIINEIERGIVSYHSEKEHGV